MAEAAAISRLHLLLHNAGVINTLAMVASMANVNKASCNKICALGFDVLSMLDHAGMTEAGPAAACCAVMHHLPFTWVTVIS